MPSIGGSTSGTLGLPRVRAVRGRQHRVLLDWLAAQGLAENTVVIYTSDQGFFLGDHGMYDKRFMYGLAAHAAPRAVARTDPSGQRRGRPRHQP